MSRKLLTTAAVAAATFGLAFANGTYGLVERSVIGIAAWWAIALALGLGLWSRPPRWLVVFGGAALAGFAALSGMSILWSSSAEVAFQEFNRNALYVACFVVVGALAPRLGLDAWLNGLGFGVATVAVLALASRLVPGVVGSPDSYAQIVDLAGGRLSYPIGYWNALAALIAMSLPLLVRVATAGASRVSRGLGLALVPVGVATMYLTSSRGGLLAGAVALLAFVLLSPRRVEGLVALVVAGAGAVVALDILRARPSLTNVTSSGAFDSSGGGTALLLIAATACSVGIAWATLSAVGARWKAGPRAQTTALVATLVAVVAAVLVADPAGRFESFKQATPVAYDQHDYINQHLMSSSGNGRWQLWGSAIDEWREYPLLGDGAGSFQAWWSQHGTLGLFVRDAHSLYAEVLAELGLAGFVLLVAFVAGGALAGFWALRGARDGHRVAIAAATGAFLAFAVAAGVDWVWEVGAVALPGVALAALLFSSGGGPQAPRPGGWRGFGSVRFALAAVAAGLAVSQALPLLVELRLDASRDAAQRRHYVDALEHAVAARKLQPWAASPYLQIALIAERSDLPAARKAIEQAVQRSKDDWSLWLVAARIQTLQGDVIDAKASLARVRDLNPRVLPLPAGP